ncbi:acyltransferase family protein [Cellvibrio zantedeschiae]|uniref:acyltransferase family protein n=1 Tax=Cellvibrio zantedeschiae TaxID=1237077 RepID=UPI0016771070|nr:acyltransferase [Cellvibrio zantedeschiae]
MNDISPPKESMRLRSIDGLRGIAAMGVVLYHLSGNLKEDLQQLLPAFLNTIMSYGYLGVPVFFVISGLVISLSIGDSLVTKHYAAKFIVRRSIRLDPTYWAAIFFGIALLIFKNKISAVQEPLPSVGNILAHMFYLQDLLTVRPLISVVFWTLCLEIQFYLFYLFSLWISQKVTKKLNISNFHLLIIIGLGVFSILVDRSFYSLSVNGLFISNWHYFLIGVLVARVFRRKAYSTQVFFIWILFECITSLYFGEKPYQTAGIIIGIFLYALWWRSLLDRVFTSATLQYLGTISYTLYLVHPDIGWKVISTARMFFHGHLPKIYVIPVLLAAIVVSIIVAHIFHLLFEKPSLRLAEKLKKVDFENLFSSKAAVNSQ